MQKRIELILKEWLQAKDCIIFTDDIAINEVVDEILASLPKEQSISDEEIEKQILKIIDNSFEKISLPGIGKNDTDDGFIFNKNKASKEIAAILKNMYPAVFMDWLCFDNDLFYPDMDKMWLYYGSIKKAKKYVKGREITEEGGALMTTREVYEFWKKEIKKGE